MNIYQAIAIASASLAVLVGAWDAWRLRKAQRYSGPVMAITAGAPVLSLWLYLLVTGLSLRPAASIGLVTIGAAVGLLAGRRASIVATGPGGHVRLVGASWLPLPAALCVAALQVSSAAESLAGQILSLAALEAAVAFGAGAALMLAWRRNRVGGAGRASPAQGPALGPGWGRPPAA